MMDITTRSDLARRMKEKSDEYTRKMGPALEELAKIAAHYDPPGEKEGRAAKLIEIRKNLATDAFRVIVVGRFKNGKSTFLNALLGKLTQPTPDLPEGGAPLPTSDLPCTPTLTSIIYQDTPSVRLLRRGSKTWEEKSMSWYLSKARVQADAEEHKKAFEDVLQFELSFPVELCKAGVILIDSPGTDDDPERNAITDEALFESDAAIVLFRSDALAGTQEREYVKTMIGIGLQRYFSVVNLWDGRGVDNQLRTFTWNKLVTQLKGGPPYSGQDLESQDIYFVDAETALQGKLKENPALINSSGLTYFERRLSAFLEKDRRAVHIERFVAGANSYAQKIAELIAKRIPMIEMEQNKFQAKYQEIQPQLEQIRARTRRLKKIFERHRRECQQQLQDSFEQLFLQIRQDLPNELRDWKIPSLHTESFLKNMMAKALSQFQRKKLCDEAVKKELEIVKDKVVAWQQAPVSASGASQIIKNAIERLMKEVNEEVAAIERQYDQVNFHLLGWDPQQAQLNIKGPHWLERVGAAGLGVVIGSPDYILTGGMGGFKGLGRDLAVRVAIAVPLILLHAPFLPVVIPASMAAGLFSSIFWGASSLEKEIKEKAIQQLVYGDPKTGDDGLRGEPERARPHLARIVEGEFGKIEAGIRANVEALIKDEETNIQVSLRESACSADEKKKLVAQMKAHLQSLKANCSILNDALVAAKQV